MEIEKLLELCNEIKVESPVGKFHKRFIVKGSKAIIDKFKEELKEQAEQSIKLLAFGNPEIIKMPTLKLDKFFAHSTGEIIFKGVENNEFSVRFSRWIKTKTKRTIK